MGEAQAARVKHLARRLDPRRRKVPSPVDRIAQDGVARCCEVHANLMRPSRLEPHRDEGCGAEPLENPVMRDGAAAVFSGFCDAAAPVAGVSNEISVEEAVFRDSASDERDVLAFDVVSAKESLQVMEGLAVAREDESTGRVAVQPVNHERDGAPRIPVMQVLEHQGKKGVAFMLGRRNREESGGLVDDQKIRILDEHGQARANPATLRTARVKRERPFVADVAAGLIPHDPGDIDAPGTHRVPGGPAGEPKPARDRQVESHWAGGEGAGRGTRIVTKNCGSPIRALAPEPGPKEAAGANPSSRKCPSPTR